MPKTIVPAIAALWLALTAIAAWSTIAFAIAALAAVVLGAALLASAVTGSGSRRNLYPNTSKHIGSQPLGRTSP
ncbi:MAG: hypothetical protein EOP32_13985 [Rhodococcus sp. (in: high G+C Gram-positive bacteria)]|nr:MAG: hypothetical protein EOP32_13985 [Rhodococcus sp. (in: high G+C Gram-positive bacteria)]